MGRHWCRGMGDFGHQGGLSDPFLHPSSVVIRANSPPELFPQFHQGESPVSRTGVSSPQGSFGTCSQVSRILQQGICGTEGKRYLETNNRSLDTEPVCGIYDFPHGDSSFSVKVSASRGLDGVNRPERCLPSDSNASELSEIPQVCKFIGHFPIQSTLFRPDHGTSSIYKGDGSCFSLYAQEGLQNAKIPRRLVNSRCVGGRSDSSEGRIINDLQETGNFDQSKEEQSISFPVLNLPGNEDRFQRSESLSNSGENSESVNLIRGLHVDTGSTSKELEVPVGVDVFPVSFSSGVQAQDEGSSVKTSSQLGWTGEFHDKLGLELPPGSSVVVRRAKSDPRSTTEDPGTGIIHIHRRIKSRLGGNFGPSEDFRCLVKTDSRGINKFQGVEGHSVGYRSLHTKVEEQESGDHVRQQHGHLVPEEVGRNKIKLSEQLGTSDHKKLRKMEHTVNTSICSGFSQCYCRQPQQEEPGFRGRMDSERSRFQGYPSSVASSGGSVCHKSEPPSSQLLLPGVGSSVFGNGCNAPGLEQSVGLCLPSVWHGASGHRETKEVQELHNDLNSPVLASKAMVLGNS